MKRLGRLLVLALAVVAFSAGFFLIAANRDPVVLDLLFWPQLEVRVGFALVLAFAAGSLSGLLVGMLSGGAERLLNRRAGDPR